MNNMNSACAVYIANVIIIVFKVTINLHAKDRPAHLFR